jgi:glycosyltransferase involved in cell wall biosynthesis
MIPLVSVIIPVYNAEKYIRQTIESVLCQTMGDFEIIVMNDGSKDGSEAIILDIQKSDNRIIYQYKPNSGVSDTRNKMIALTKGKYIAFLDADDIWKQDNLQKKIETLSKTGKKWTFSNMDFIGENNQTLNIPRSKLNPYNVMDNLLLWEADVVPGPCSNIVVEKDFLGEDIRFDTRLSSPADRDFCLQLAAKEEPVYINEKLWLYRLHSQSMTNTNSKVIDEMICLYKKADKKRWFSSRRLRRKALSNVNLILAGISFHFPQQRKRMVGFLFKSFWYSPLNVVQKKILPIFRQSKKTKIQ